MSGEDRPSPEAHMLIAEDSEADALLLIHALRTSHYVFRYERVCTPQALAGALARRRWDVVVSDYLMPDFTAIDALRIVKKQDPEIPFIVVSGAIGEATAVAAMRAGADDYIMKGNLARLAPAIDRELRDAETRRELRRSEEAQRLHERRLHQVVESMPMMMAALDEEGLIVAWNHECERVTGYTAEEVIGNPAAAELLYPDPEYRAEVDREQEAHKNDYQEWEVRVASKHGGERILSLHNTSVLQPIPGWATWFSAFDITARKQAERSLRESEERFRELAERLPEIVFEMDQDGQLLFINRQGCAIMGYSEEELLGGFPAVEMIVPGDRERVTADMELIDRGESSADNEYTALRKDGSTFPIIVNSAPIWRNGRTAGVRGFAVDITNLRKAEEQRRKLEEQLLQTQKLESLAILTGGIAHDFNNLLTGILGHADLVRRDLSANAAGRENLQQIVTAAKRAAALTKQMLVYSGRERTLFEEVDLTAAITQVVGALQERAGNAIRVLWHREGEDLRLQGDKGQLGQVLKTLVTNAVEAFNGRSGTVSVTTGRRQCDSGDLAEAQLGGSLTPGSYVFLEVSDDGCGMDEATRAKVFDPFYSTKFAGRGLGLAAVLGIVRSHRGAVKVVSHPDSGTTVTVLLPPAP
jgi:two-component system, cell cycle sensor histidine kinase and response regulator CckA